MNTTLREGFGQNQHTVTRASTVLSDGLHHLWIDLITEKGGEMQEFVALF